MERLERSLREAPIVEKDGYHYFVNPISDGVPTVDPRLLREVGVRIVQQTDFRSIDKIVTPAAMGIHISTTVSLMTDVPIVVVRKREYGLDGETPLYKETGYEESQMYINDVYAGDRVLVIDDVLSTGGTLSAIVEALGDIGAEIQDVIVAIRKADGTTDLGFEVKTLADVVVEDGEVEIVEGPQAIDQ